MAIIITDECINCGACEPECPNTAIYEAAVNWKYSDGTSLTGDVNLLDGKIVNAELPQRAVNDEVYYISIRSRGVPAKAPSHHSCQNRCYRYMCMDV